MTRDVTYLHRSIRTNKVENGESWQLHWASHLFHVLASRAFHFVWNIRLIEWRLTYHARAKDRARKSREGAAKRRKNFTLFLYFFFLFLSFLPFFSKFIETDHAKSQIMGGRWRVPAGVPCPSIQVFQRAWSRTNQYVHQYVHSNNINTFFHLFTSILKQQDVFNFTDDTKRTFKFDFTLIDNSIKLAGLKNNTYIDVITSAEGNWFSKILGY